MPARATWPNCSEPRAFATCESTVEHADLELPDFDAWWEPFTLGVGPAGDYVAHLDPAGQASLRERCRAMIPGEPFRRSW